MLVRFPRNTTTPELYVPTAEQQRGIEALVRRDNVNAIHIFNKSIRKDPIRALALVQPCRQMGLWADAAYFETTGASAARRRGCPQAPVGARIFASIFERLPTYEEACQTSDAT
jgi:hypothetical protein